MNICDGAGAALGDGSHFGEHVMIDLYGCAEEMLDDRFIILSCLTELPRRLMMRPLAPPEIHFAPGGGPKDPGGWTGFVVIQESHISIHTFPASGFASIDVYTCRNGLDVSSVEGYFTKILHAKTLETNFVRRGTRYRELVLDRQHDTAFRAAAL